MAVAWARIVQHFYDLYVHSGGEHFERNDGLLGWYRAPKAWSDFVLKCEIGLPSRGRTEILPNMRPSPKLVARMTT